MTHLQGGRKRRRYVDPELALAAACMVLAVALLAVLIIAVVAVVT